MALSQPRRPRSPAYACASGNLSSQGTTVLAGDTLRAPRARSVSVCGSASGSYTGCVTGQMLFLPPRVLCNTQVMAS